MKVIFHDFPVPFMCILQDFPAPFMSPFSISFQDCWVDIESHIHVSKMLHNQLTKSGKSITFCRIPSHVGIRGNEDADIAAKAGLDVPITHMRFPVSDLLTCVNQLCVKEWQQVWNQCA